MHVSGVDCRRVPLHLDHSLRETIARKQPQREGEPEADHQRRLDAGTLESACAHACIIALVPG
jgi:hypothetical protein